MSTPVSVEQKKKASSSSDIRYVNSLCHFICHRKHVLLPSTCVETDCLLCSNPVCFLSPFRYKHGSLCESTASAVPLCVHHSPCVSGLTRSWKMYRLFVAAMAMIFSDGCQAMCRIFLVKSKLSTPTSPRRRLPPVYTLRVRSTARGLLLSRQASSVTPRPVSLSNILKKLLYAPVMMTLRTDRDKGASDWE